METEVVRFASDHLSVLAEFAVELQKILDQKYKVPEKYANTIQVGNIGVIS